MKLRIKGNSLRLRLSMAEVKQVAKSGKVEEHIRFGGTQQLTYRLVAGDILYLTAGFEADTMTVQVPLQQAVEWADSDQVGFEAECSIGDGEVLHVLVEKDFQCLTERPREDESDLFENPRAGQGHG